MVSLLSLPIMLHPFVPRCLPHTALVGSSAAVSGIDQTVPEQDIKYPGGGLVCNLLSKKTSGFEDDCCSICLQIRPCALVDRPLSEQNLTVSLVLRDPSNKCFDALGLVVCQSHVIPGQPRVAFGPSHSPSRNLVSSLICHQADVRCPPVGYVCRRGGWSRPVSRGGDDTL